MHQGRNGDVIIKCGIPGYLRLVGLQEAGRDGVVEVVVVKVGRPMELGVAVELAMFDRREDVQHDHAAGVDRHRELTGVLHGAHLAHEHLVHLQEEGQPNRGRGKNRRQKKP